ncbi:methionyl-tRNA formyltransferase [Frigoribacterium sp. VKM Ac-2836]|uniref:methionyl-tRNA formyltransferase n=1 Tax=Frigoribacterium sp. VKM Ac-2836 TaxID=2739014 RepID=UPI0015663972|nr:methionyl-tRNA formyltransferase [Frigoribacterium sp. VKM Ac-2836]NRD25974.1 methionyl-tRNA formyltransferase [Frigoribacterium sp. VKM Ac-2836]
MRLVFAGSPAAAVPSLTALAEGPHEVVAVLTRDDTPQGRKRVLTPTPVAVEAERLGLRVVKARRITPEVTAELSALDSDLGVVVAYGALLREPLLGAPRLGWVNLHFSLLPAWRGAAPVQRSLMAGDDMTGAVVFQLVPELDAGDVYGTLRRPLDGTETAGTLLDELARFGSDLLVDVVARLADGTAVPRAQTGRVTHASKLTLADGVLDASRPAAELINRFRGVTPEPGARVDLDGVGLKITEARMASADEAPLEAGRLESRGRRLLLGTASAPVELVRVQPAGKRDIPAADWWRGLPTGVDRRVTLPTAPSSADPDTETAS